MRAQLILPELRWFYLGVTRLLLALACVVLLFSSVQPHRSLTLLTTGFALYSVVPLIWKRMARAGGPLLSLVLDTVFFLAFVSYEIDRSLWLCSIWYVYLLISAALLHGLWDVLVVAVACTAFLSLAGSAQTEMLWRPALLGGLLACVLSFQKRRLEERLQGALRRADVLRAEAEQARESEREQIAADFHDGPLQTFISMQMRLEIIKKMMERDPEAGMQELRQLQELCHTQTREFRAHIRTLRRAEAAGNDLVAGVRHAVEDFQKDSDIAATFVSSDAMLTVAPEACRDLLQVVREALHNVRKHSQASRVAVSLDRDGKTLEIEVDDNGKGFGFSGTYTLAELEALRLGPQSLQRRVRSLGGELVLESRPGRGAGLKVRVTV